MNNPNHRLQELVKLNTTLTNEKKNLDGEVDGLENMRKQVLVCEKSIEVNNTQKIILYPSYHVFHSIAFKYSYFVSSFLDFIVTNC